MAYVLPAAAAWGVLGMALQPLDTVPLLVPLIVWLYSLWFGIVETFGVRFRAPSLAWQVPARWIQRRTDAQQAVIWGTVLGPGWATVNPYAGIWLLPFLVVMGRGLFMAAVVGVMVGVIHGGARAMGVLSNSRHVEVNNSHLMILGQRLRWRYMDGLTLLLAAGALVAYLLTLLGPRFSGL